MGGGGGVRVAAIFADRRPVGTDGRQRRIERGEFASGVNNSAIADGEDGFDAANLFVRAGEVVVAQHGEIGELAFSQRTLPCGFTAEPRAALRVEAQSVFARE